MTETKRITVCLHAPHEGTYARGIDAGLTGEALRVFVYEECSVFPMELSVATDGRATIASFAGRALAPDGEDPTKLRAERDAWRELALAREELVRAIYDGEPSKIAFRKVDDANHKLRKLGVDPYTGEALRRG